MSSTINNRVNIVGLEKIMGKAAVGFEEEIIGDEQLKVEDEDSIARDYAEQMRKLEQSAESNFVTMGEDEGDGEGEEEAPEIYETVPETSPLDYKWDAEDSGRGSSEPRKQRFTDQYMNSLTDEQEKQGVVDRVFEDTPEYDISKLSSMADEDDRTRMLVQIETLKESLEEDGIDLTKIDDVGTSSSTQNIKTVLKTLRMMADKNRYCSFANEIILALAHGLEYAFDGKNDWFGHKPDLRGWTNTVKAKLKRMKYDTSTFVQGIMNGYNVGGGWRLLLELLPSMFLYSRRRKITQEDHLSEDPYYKNAISELTDN